MSRISNMPPAAAADVQSSDATYLFDANGTRKDKLLTIGVLAEVISDSLEVTPSGIAPGGATEGQALIFTGGAWVPGTIPSGGGGGGSGDVAGPASAENARIAVFSGTSGKALADGGYTIGTLPVSTAAQAALDLKAPLASPAFTGTPTGITATHVGLGNVDNTADTAKPVSTAQAAALDLKAPLASPAFTGTPTGITATHVGLGNVTNTSDANKPVSTAQQSALDLKAPLANPTFTGTVTGVSAAMVSGFDAGVDTALATSPDTARTALGLGTASLLNAEDRESATCYHILSGSAYGMSETGIAADLLVSGTLALTPVAGDVTHLYPLDPATSTELPEVAEAQANRPLNALVSLTSANSAADEFALIYPTPVDAAVLAGMENRVIQTRLINDDPAATLTVTLAPYAAGRRTARWRGALTDVALDPGDELLARAFWFAGDVDVDQFLRTASYATIATVIGSAGTSTSPTGRPTPNVLTGHLVVQQVVRVGGQSITLPSGIGYATPTVTPYGTDGRLIQPTPNRSSRVAWTTAVADGTHASGAFTGATARSISAAYENVAAVRQYGAAYGDASTSIAWPALPGPRAPNSWVVGILNATGLAAAVSPSGSTEDTDYDAGAGSTVTSLSLWHYAAGEAYAPSPTTVTSCNWACTVLELTPRRID